MRRITLGVIAVALPMRIGWPARQPSPKKSPGPSIATTASRPVLDSTDSLTPPLLMYMTCEQASPWVKIVSSRPYSAIFFEKPAESRNVCALKGPPFTAACDRFGSIIEAWHDPDREAVHKGTPGAPFYRTAELADQ